MKEARVLDNVKWFAVLLLLSGGIYLNHHYAAKPLSLRLIGWVVLALVAAGLALQTEKGRNFWGFFKDAQTEIRKVVWPTRQETLQTTLIVAVMVFVVGLILWALDGALISAIAFLTGQRG